jgi:hypothetical protein
MALPMPPEIDDAAEAEELPVVLEGPSSLLGSPQPRLKKWPSDVQPSSWTVLHGHPCF